MAVYQSGVKGLFTEANPQDTPPETMKDCQDVVISRDNLAESRHGINTQALQLVSGTWNTAAYEYLDAKHTIFEAKFDTPISGYDRKYITLSPNGTQELVIPTGGNLTSSLLQYISSPSFVNTGKPIGFTFDQGIYAVTDLGWVEMKKDELNSAITHKIIDWPPFSDINIETFQDTQDFSANWLDINKKVGIRISYVWNTRYNGDLPREVESEPSQIFEVLHPMALRTQQAGSTFASTIKDRSRIRVRIGESFNQSFLPFNRYTTSQAYGRKFSIRIYRTRQVNINEALPTEYFQAAPDIPIGDSSSYVFANDSLVSSFNDTIDFGTTNAPRWQNGALFKYVNVSGPIGGLTSGSLYYLGAKNGTLFQVFNSNLLTLPINLTAPVGNFAQYLIRVYEANLTVNDDGIISLPQLYTNPNIDGTANSNAVPPIAKSVIEYKNYHVAANIREPLRSYISMVSQPLVKYIETSTQISVSGTPSTITQQTAATSLGYNLDGISANAFSVDSQFWYNSYPIVVDVTGNTLTTNTPSNTTFTGAGSFTATLPGMLTLFQTNAQITFRFTGSQGVTTITASVRPKYNRQGLYSRADDKNLEYLQFAGRLIDTNIQKKAYSVIDKVIITGTQRGQTPPDATVVSGNTISISGNNITVSSARQVDATTFDEPGIFAIGQTGTSLLIPRYYSYKTVTSDSATNVVFNNVSPIGSTVSFPLPTGLNTAYVHYIEGSSLFSAPLYHVQSPSYPTEVRFSTPTLIEDGFPQRTSFSYRKLNGYYDQPVAVSPDTTNDNITLLGPLAKSPAQLLDECMSALITELNRQVAGSAVANLVRFIKTDNVGEILVEYFNGTSIEARITGDYHEYEPPISRSFTDFTTLASYTKNNERAVAISRYNAPESFPNSSVLAPILVGEDKAKIVALAKNANDCFILKEDGIWRLSIVGNSSIANVDAVVQIDTTTFCQAPHSVKEINEEIIFLSQKGFISIAGNDIEPIGRPIETEVKEKLQTCIANGFAERIRAWVNEEKRIYGCTIPETETTFTTYVFSTYTRQWSKFSFPVIDAITDSNSKTIYLNQIPNQTLGSGSTLQEQLDNSTVSSPNPFLASLYLSEERHSGGQYRNEVDQYDYKYTPASVTLGTGNQVVLVDNTSVLLDELKKLGGTGSLLLNRGLNFFVGRPAYYKKAGLFYPCTFVSRTLTSVTVEFTTEVPPNITTIASDDGLYAGVPASITFNPSNIGSPNTNKVFSEYQLHTVEAVSALSMRFITDSRATYSGPRNFTFNRNAPNRTVYRTYIPLEQMRGRWLIRQVNHSVPGERLQVASQSLSVRDTGSPSVQKAPR